MSRIQLGRSEGGLVEVLGNERRGLTATLAYFSRFELRKRETLRRIAVNFVEIINALNIVSKCGSWIGNLTAMRPVLLSMDGRKAHVCDLRDIEGRRSIRRDRHAGW